MKYRETRIRLSEEDHERLRRAAAYGKVSMAELAKRATLDLVAKFEAEFERRILESRDADQRPSQEA
jgi:hypothetical protein